MRIIQLFWCFSCAIFISCFISCNFGGGGDAGTGATKDAGALTALIGSPGEITLSFSRPIEIGGTPKLYGDIPFAAIHNSDGAKIAEFELEPKGIATAQTWEKKITLNLVGSMYPLTAFVKSDEKVSGFGAALSGHTIEANYKNFYALLLLYQSGINGISDSGRRQEIQNKVARLYEQDLPRELAYEVQESLNIGRLAFLVPTASSLPTTNSLAIIPEDIKLVIRGDIIIASRLAWSSDPGLQNAFDTLLNTQIAQLGTQLSSESARQKQKLYDMIALQCTNRVIPPPPNNKCDHCSRVGLVLWRKLQGGGQELLLDEANNESCECEVPYSNSYPFCFGYYCYRGCSDDGEEELIGGIDSSGDPLEYWRFGFKKPLSTPTPREECQWRWLGVEIRNAQGHPYLPQPPFQRCDASPEISGTSQSLPQGFGAYDCWVCE